MCDSSNMNQTTKVGYAYVPVQMLTDTYDPAQALENGTVFPQLNIPLGSYERGMNMGGRNGE